MLYLAFVQMYQVLIGNLERIEESLFEGRPENLLEFVNKYTHKKIMGFHPQFIDDIKKMAREQQGNDPGKNSDVSTEESSTVADTISEFKYEFANPFFETHNDCVYKMCVKNVITSYYFGRA